MVAAEAAAHCGVEAAGGVNPSQPTIDPAAMAAKAATRAALRAPIRSTSDHIM
jgi:hypothetical protein